jgi:hypothetical protein
MVEPGAGTIVIRNPERYTAHPHMVALADGTWLLVATSGPRRVVTMHPPHDPDFVTVLTRSRDEGRTWSAPQVVPDPHMTGTECAGLTALPDGSVLLQQWRFRWYGVEGMPGADEEPMLATPEALYRNLIGSSELDTGIVGDVPARTLMPWARGGGDTLVHRSTDAGDSFAPLATLDVAPYSGGYGMRGGLVMRDGEIVLPLCDVPHYARVFVVRSRDGGRTWSAPVAVAEVEGRQFEEPAPVLLPSGDILLLLRENVSRTLFSVRSRDGGQTWTAPRSTGIEAYPADLLALPGGRLEAVVGRRQPPFGIQIVVSHDGGVTWDTTRPDQVRADLPSRDLGYPTMLPASDGTLVVAFYFRDSSGVTAVHAVRVPIEALPGASGSMPVPGSPNIVPGRNPCPA